MLVLRWEFLDFGSCWIRQGGKFTPRTSSRTNCGCTRLITEQQAKKRHNQLMFSRACKLLFYGIRPIFVLMDQQRLPNKNEQRREEGAIPKLC